MTGKVQKRREELRIRIIEIAEDIITTDGIDALKARNLAKRAECAVGAIYNVFDDLQDIVIAVNGRTFHHLGIAISERVKDMEDADPTDRLITMSFAYLDFARKNPNLWRCLFEFKLSVDMDVPDWYWKEMMRLFGFISGPLKKIFPEKSDDDIALMTRTLFSSVHGIVMLGLENRISGVPYSQLESMIALILKMVTQTLPEK